jgi:hypothetical protein
MIKENIIQALCTDVPAPADAVDEPSDWEEWEGGGYGCAVDVYYFLTDRQIRWSG